MRMKAKFLIAALAALLLSAVMIGQAGANSWEWVEPSACSSSDRVSDADSDCLDVWFSNNWNWQHAGYGHSVQNKCSEYGTLVVNVDTKNSYDIK